VASTSAQIGEQIARELELRAASVQTTIDLLDGGATVPFLARYRKERTGGLDEEQIRAIRDRVEYLRKLDERKQAVLREVEKQGKLTEELRAAVLACTRQVDLEDLYLPYKPRKQTRATKARERGLEPLALLIGQQPDEGDPLTAAAGFVDAEKGVPDADAALAGARDILAEAVAERADVRGFVRDRLRESDLVTTPVDGEDLTKTKYKDYSEFLEPVAHVKPHRYLAVCRGENEKKLKVGFSLVVEALEAPVAELVGLRSSSPMAGELRAAVGDGLARLIVPAVEREVRADLGEKAETAAIDVFASNLKDLLMSAPLGARPVLGVDPGLRTGCKVAAVDGTGALVAHEKHPLSIPGESAASGAGAVRAMAERIKAVAVAVGTGTGGREALACLRDAIGADSGITVVAVSEAGASVYSASPLAKKELPDVDVTVRGAVSIARRLQDPLAELVKIDPRHIGVGQYQHDVDQKNLRSRLDDVVESCVNQVGVDLNTASPSLLRYVAGIGPKLAERIVEHRVARGRFTCRRDVQDVSGVGPRVFEQSAGFLRVRESTHPLDDSAVHPERYALVEQMSRDLGIDVSALVGNESLARGIDISRYVTDEIGEPTLRDIVAELGRPGRDPRREFEAPSWRDDVHAIEDLRADMEIEGVVTNITDFGAFVDIGVHQDGLVHISQLADRFVSDPREVVRVGQKLKVRVLDVDLERTRISLSARSKASAEPRRKEAEPAADEGRRPEESRDTRDRRGPRGGRGDRGERGGKGPEQRPKQPGFGYTPFADILRKMGK
jgi:uncharacterized protein